MRVIVLLSLCFAASGCVYVPGSVMGAVSDAFTGAEGEHCVGWNAKVGGTVNIPAADGRPRIFEVKSISGTSSRCRDPEYPFRALLVQKPSAPTSTNVQVYEAK